MIIYSDLPDTETLPTTIALGVTREDWNHAVFCRGAKQTLIAVGVAQPEWFPVAGERNKRNQAVRFKKLTVDARARRIAKIRARTAIADPGLLALLDQVTGNES